MKKYIVLSVNDNVDYFFFLPLTIWSWRKIGWEPIVFYHRMTGVQSTRHKELESLSMETGSGEFRLYTIKNVKDYRSDTITQISRLYAASIVGIEPNDYLMTGDIDMLALSDYWKPDTSKVTVYGHDLTGFGHFPICYIGMPSFIWQGVMNISPNNKYNESIQRDLDTLPQAKDTDFYKYWFSDQDLITERLKQYGTGKIDFINRGQGSHGYARGRVDRANGGWVFNQPELIDAHLMQQTHHSEEKIQKLMDLLHHVWPQEDFKWFEDYTREFKKLAV